MIRVLALAALLVSFAGPAVADPTPAPATPETTSTGGAGETTAPMDLSGRWRQLEVVVELVQNDSEVRGRFRYVAPNGFAIQAGDPTIRGSLDGRVLRGKIRSRGLFEECPDLIVHGDLHLAHDPEDDQLRGTAQVRDYLVEGCEPRRWQTLELDLRRDEPGMLCPLWRARLDEVRDRWVEKVEAYEAVAAPLDATTHAWWKENTKQGKLLLAAANGYEGVLPQLLQVDRIQNPEWIVRAVETVETVEEVVGWIMLAKGAAGALGRAGSRVAQQASERALARAVGRATMRFPRLMRWLERTASRSEILRLTGVSRWADHAFKLRNTEYFRFGNARWLARVRNLDAGKDILHQMDTVRWDAFQGALRDLDTHLKRAHPEAFQNVDVIFTGSSSGVARRVLRDGKLPSAREMEAIEDYAGLGSDIDFQFVMRNPRPGAEDAFYKLQQEVEGKFNELFARRIGFHPDLVDVKLFPTSSWARRGAARNSDEALDDLVRDLEYNRRKFHDGEYYITPGSRQMKELMDEAGDSYFRVGRGGFRRVDAADHFAGVNFHPGISHGVVEESALFGEAYLRKVARGSLDVFQGARKYSKYYLRSAFGRLMSHPEAAAILNSRAFREGLQRSGKDLQSATVELAQRFRGSLFNEAELRSLDRALRLKSSRNPRGVVDGDEALAREFLEGARGNLMRWNDEVRESAGRHWDQALRDAPDDAARLAIEAERDAASYARTFSLTRGMDDTRLLDDLGVSPERRRLMDAARQRHPPPDNSIEPRIEPLETQDAGASLRPTAPVKTTLFGAALELLNPATYTAKVLGEGYRGLLTWMTEDQKASLEADLVRLAGYIRAPLIQLRNWNWDDHGNHGLPDPAPSRKAFRELFEDGGERPLGYTVYLDFLPVIPSASDPADRECLEELKIEWEAFLDQQAEALAEIREHHEPAVELAELAEQLGSDFSFYAERYYMDQVRHLDESTVIHPASGGPAGIARVFAVQVLEKMEKFGSRLAR